MNASITIFILGIALLGLFLWYFGTDSGVRKRWIGSILTVLLAGFCTFAIFYTGHYPDQYQILLNPVAEGEQLISASTRDEAVRIVSEELAEEGVAEDESSLAVAASANTIYLSRRDLPRNELAVAADRLHDELNVDTEIIATEKPPTDIRRGIDLQGGSSFIVQLGNPEEGMITPTAREQAIAVFEKRLNPTGAIDLTIIPQGEDRLEIQMPGIKPEEIDEVRRQIEQVAKLEFRLVHPESSRLLSEKEAAGDDIILEPGWVEMEFREGPEGESEEDRRSLVVRNRPDITGEGVNQAFAHYGVNGWAIALRATNEGADQFRTLTEPNVGQRMAIIIDEEILSAPVINDVLSDNIEISGEFDEVEAHQLASNLENPLEIAPQIIDERSVGAAYGANTVKQGIYAGITGLALTFLFVVIYYRIAGLVALIGLTVNIILLLGCMAIFDFTLTMPGIAGIVLTIGIAVDANVLIYERLREELKSGKSIKAAIEAAYDKAFSAIFDANITTLLTAVILFIVASGTVKGFAITLTIGILASLFAALLVTRVCFSWLNRAGLIRKMGLMNLIPDRRYDFMGKRKLAAICSIALIAVSVGTLAVRNVESLSVDFRGGDMITVQANEGVTEADVRSALSDVGFQVFTQRQASPSGDEFVTIRTLFGNGDAVQAELAEDLGSAFDNFEIQSVGPLIGAELLRSSIFALILGLIAILIYLTFRFEFSFALGAIIALIHDIAIVLGFVILLGEKFSLIHVGAFLTVAGYSINDTIVVFDRIRETLRMQRGDVKDLMNIAISETLSRTLLTSSTTLLTLICLIIFGGPALRDFSVTIIVGILIGTYSSIFVASPIVLWWSKRSGRNLRREILDADQARIVDNSGIEREVPNRDEKDGSLPKPGRA